MIGSLRQSKPIGLFSDPADVVECPLVVKPDGFSYPVGTDSKLPIVRESEPVRSRLFAGGGSHERTRLWEGQIPCYSGKIQGISSNLVQVTRICRRNGRSNQALTSKFPTRWNRELIGPYQGIKSPFQGIKSAYQGRAVSILWVGVSRRSGGLMQREYCEQHSLSLKSFGNGPGQPRREDVAGASAAETYG
jgi:hypothetical protein